MTEIRNPKSAIVNLRLTDPQAGTVLALLHRRTVECYRIAIRCEDHGNTARADYWLERASHYEELETIIEAAALVAQQKPQP